MKTTYKEIFAKADPDIINNHLGWYYVGNPSSGIICKSETAYTICQAMKRYAHYHSLLHCDDVDINKSSSKTIAIRNYSLSAESMMLDALGINKDSHMMIQLDGWFDQETEMSDNDDYSSVAINILRTLTPMNKRNYVAAQK